MIFSATVNGRPSLELMREGLKVGTTRIWKASYRGYPLGNRYVFDEIRVLDAGGKERLLYRVGNEYAAQPGRGIRAENHIRCLRLERYPLHEMSAFDIIDEGYDILPSDPREELDKMMRDWRQTWDAIYEARPWLQYEENPTVLHMTFEMVE